MSRPDPHSYTDFAQPLIAAFDWDARVDFATKTIDAEVTLRLREPGTGALDLDTRALEIHSVADEEGTPLLFELAPEDPILGSRLRIALRPETQSIRIHYRTSPGASALQWLEPSMTQSGEPFLFSQCQAIHARSVIPLQDTPANRITYRARVRVPRALTGLMAARALERVEGASEAIEHFEMPQPIPPYLLAFAVGKLVSRELGPRSRVWAEPGTVDRAAFEFHDVDAMLTTAESLFGPYDWDRFDLLVMPPSFPYGGMENPRLTFLTPTLLAGDRSLVSVVAHELAHSWTGNLVTNANAEHFWLNEGFTVYAERRILEALEGVEAAELHAALGRRTLDREIQRFESRPALTRLRTTLAGVDPDEAFSSIPYEKGYFLLRRLEELAGRSAFDGFLRRYIDTFRFRSIVTDDFLRLFEASLPGVLERAGADAWISHAGVPADAPVPHSDLLARIEACSPTEPPEEAANWSPTEWQVWLARLTKPVDLETIRRIDARWHLTAARNPEVLVAWLEHAVAAGHSQAITRAAAMLAEVGRLKYLRPLYQAFCAFDPSKNLARDVFTKASPRYHPLARQMVSRFLETA